jgi:CIC family chloride channel protein
MTSVLMIFEMTRDYPVIVPLMISNMISLFICSLMQHEPTYEALAIQDGIHLPSAGSRARLGMRQVAMVMRPPENLVSCELTVREALEQFHANKFRTLIVTDTRGVIGVVSQLTLEQQLDKYPEQTLEEIVDVIKFPHVHADQGLDQALERMGANHVDVLPVVNRANVHKLEGIVTLKDVLDAYGVEATP